MMVNLYIIADECGDEWGNTVTNQVRQTPPVHRMWEEALLLAHSATSKLKSASGAAENNNSPQPITRRVFFCQRPNSDQWGTPVGGGSLDALRLVIDASLVAKFSTWRTEAEWDSRESIHCTGAGPTILALWLWSSQAKYSRRQVFLAGKRVPALIRHSSTWDKQFETSRGSKISTLSVKLLFSRG